MSASVRGAAGQACSVRIGDISLQLHPSIQNLTFYLKFSTDKRKSASAAPDAAARVEEMLKRERLEEVTEELTQVRSEIQSLNGQIRQIHAGSQDAQIASWYSEKRKDERESLRLTVEALQAPSARGAAAGSDTVSVPADVDTEMHGKMEKFLKKVFSMKQSEFFRKPVTLGEADDYYEIIKNPTDLSSIRIRFSQGLIKTRQDLWRYARSPFARLASNATFRQYVAS